MEERQKPAAVESDAVSESDDSEMDSDGDVKLGNKLFDSGDEETKRYTQVLNLKDPELARAIID
jgi:hypothetical protein